MRQYIKFLGVVFTGVGGYSAGRSLLEYVSPTAILACLTVALALGLALAILVIYLLARRSVPESGPLPMPVAQQPYPYQPEAAPSQAAQIAQAVVLAEMMRQTMGITNYGAQRPTAAQPLAIGGGATIGGDGQGG